MEGFRNKDVPHSIAQSLYARAGLRVSARTVARWESVWRAREAAIDMSREQALAIAACHGDSFSLEALAKAVNLFNGWRAWRESRITQAVREFLRKPDPKNYEECRLQMTLMMLETQISAAKDRRTPWSESGASAEAAVEDQDVRDTAEKMFAAMNRIAFSPGTTVTFYRLRQQPELADIPKQIFDRAALLLASERRVLLSIHDHAAALPAEDRDALVTDGLGKFYVSIYAR